ncbi:uncharacterized protein BO96DRAFT_22148 [Aspergillus niger CBS 101883]|uniref:uncharacterized protein n=1 Tax=Aspergillus lacticoffeatus (strain CBS 101883) TaxID=1450533 RepID=UPI000D7F6FC4|nr:uncharacterized protein BO96DRAFT_22148 [Aspergillus niger CBS 101883]PYH62772.1 hypothetical protein BO96DRAFT_22148 [Aspergillus niger CBS 101883]
MAVMPVNPSTLLKMQQKTCLLEIAGRLITMTQSTCTHGFQGSLSRTYHYPIIRRPSIPTSTCSRHRENARWRLLILGPKRRKTLQSHKMPVSSIEAGGMPSNLPAA